MKKLIAMLLALVMVLALAACAPAEQTSGETTDPAPATGPVTDEETEPADDETEPADDGIMTYEEYAAAELDTEVTVECYVQAHQSWWEDKITVYAQDKTGAYFLYELACSEEDAEKLTEGTKIRVTGYKGEWSGEVEIMDGTFEFVEDADTYVAEPADLTDLLGTEELIEHQNKKVAFKGLTVVESNDDGAAFLYKWDGSGAAGDDLYFNVKLGEATFTFCVESYLTGDGTDVYEAVEALQVGDVIDVEGFLYWYEGVQPHITAVARAAG